MKKAISFILYTLMPSILFAFYCFVSDMHEDLKLIIFLFIFILSIVEVYLFYKYKPCSIWALLMGFILCPITAFIDDYNNPETFYNYYNFGYIHSATYSCILFYSLPLILISLLILLYQKLKH